MRLASHAPQPTSYFTLLRALFKSIGGGKFEQLYKEFLPLLPALLPALIRSHDVAAQQSTKELLLELCLTLPARLSALLPHLHMLMQPVLHALRSSPEQVSLALRTVEFWCLCFSQAAGIGCGLAVLNNYAQLTQALSCTYAPGAADLACKYGGLGAQDPATAFVKLFSIFNCLGRMISGYVSQRYLAEQGVARPLFLFIASALTCCVCFVSAFASVDTLFISAVLGGFAFGCHWCLTPTILSELFGMGSFATIYQTMSCFPAVSSILMVSLLSGKLYDRHSQPVRVSGVARDVCLGPACFRLTYLICCGVALAACASSYTVFARSQKLYRRIQLHLKEE